MQGTIRELCALSILCGVAMSIMPEGGVKRVSGVLCAAVLLIAIVTPIKELDFDAYAQQLARYREQEARITASGDEIKERLNRLVIEEEYETYIMDKAREKGFTVKEVEVEVQWSTEGIWLPYAAEILSDATSAQRAALTECVAAELGIPEERLVWNSDE